MKKIQKSLCIFICICALILSVCVNSFAASEDNGIYVTVSADKNSYSAIGTATITVQLKNTSNETLKNINVAPSFTNTSPIGNTNPYSLGIEIEPGETEFFSYKATIAPKKLNFFMSFLLQIKHLFSGTARTVDTKSIGSSIKEVQISLNFGGTAVSDEIYVWQAESKDVYLTPRNKAEAIENENRRHQNRLADIENDYETTINLIDVRKDALVEEFGISYTLSASYYQSKIDELNTEIIELQRMINALEYDNSASSIKKRLEYTAEKEELEEKRNEYSSLLALSIMFEQLDNERAIAAANRDKAISNENTLHQNNLAEIETNY